MTMLPVLAFAFGTLAVIAVAYVVLWSKTVAIDQRLREVTGVGPTPGDDGASKQVYELLQRVGRRLPKSPKELGTLQLRLIQAGFRRSEALPVFLAIRVGVAVLAFAVCATPILMRPSLTVALAALGVGYVLPGIVLARLAKRRQHRIRLSLADALDLLVISVEAGLGLDQALMRVSQELEMSHPDLAGELRLVNLELLAGTPRPEALRNLARRTGVDDLNSLVAMLVQTDKFGTSVANSLRVFSDTLRTKRRQRAEEAAAKTGVKMVFPLVLCIFPAIWVVTIGPAAIRFVTVLFPIIEAGQ